jgi:hypothetical protein
LVVSTALPVWQKLRSGESRASGQPAGSDTGALKGSEGSNTSDD